MSLWILWAVAGLLGTPIRGGHSTLTREPRSSIQVLFVKYARQYSLLRTRVREDNLQYIR